MTTLSALKSGVASWVVRDDLDTIFPTLIQNVEAQIRRDLRLRAQVVNEVLPLSGQSTALPSGWLDFISLSVDTSTNTKRLESWTPEQFYEHRYSSESGLPRVYTIVGDNFLVGPSSADASVRAIYYRAFDALVKEQDTNWLLTNAFDLYLYGTIREAAIWMQSIDVATGDLMAVSEGQYLEALERVKRDERRARSSGSSVRRVGGNVY